MDAARLDDLIRNLANTKTRRAWIVAIPATVLGGRGTVAARRDDDHRRKRPYRRCDSDRPCPDLRVCSVSGRCIASDRCDGVPPLCPDCKEPRCNPASGEFECRSFCRGDQVCCDGHCEPRCDNGCETDPERACTCMKPPAADQVYCAQEHICGHNPCSAGRPYDSARCECACPAEATACAGVPARDWPVGDGVIQMPAGCCPLWKYATWPNDGSANAGRSLCAAPGSGSGWWCDA